MKYWLPQHVYLCAVQDSVVFLDVRRDKYFGLGGKEMRALAAVVPAWPNASKHPDEPPISANDSVRVAEVFVRKGLLTPDETAGKPATPVVLDLGGFMRAAGDGLEQTPIIRPRHVALFVLACVSTLWALRFRSLEQIVERVKARKQSAVPAAGSQDIEALVQIFRRLRCYLFTARGHCLFHALALTGFLARQNKFPTWVIGVRTTPWGAHSWVQQDSVVLDATPEEIRFFTPILAV